MLRRDLINLTSNLICMSKQIVAESLVPQTHNVADIPRLALPKLWLTNWLYHAVLRRGNMS